MLRSLFESALRFIVPTSWIAVALTVLLPARSKRIPSLAVQAAGFFSSAFVTRLAIEHHESRYQIVGFMGAAAVLETLRMGRCPSGARLEFWAAAAIGASLGVVLARPISHHYWLGPW